VVIGTEGNGFPDDAGESGEQFNDELRIRTVARLSDPNDPDSPVERVVTFLQPDGSGPLTLPGTDTDPDAAARSVDLIVVGDVLKRGRGSGSLTRSGRGRFRVRGNVILRPQ
jgi:hypothetical protein